MTHHDSPELPPGWVGGFAESNPAFAYPRPDMSTVEILDNLANIPRLQRQQPVKWPEFSWETEPGNSDSRCFQMFAQDISRLGYDDTGRVWSIICPQQGVVVDGLGALNVEVTVTGQRGWADETDRELYADMSVEGTIWFSPSAHQHWWVKAAWELFAHERLPFPSTKAQAIKVTTHRVGDSTQPLFPLYSGECKEFTAPEFARHPHEAWNVGNLQVQIGPNRLTGHDAVDTFNEHIVEIFNQASGNMLADSNILTWNVWFTPPALVDTEEWRTHAERWRHSIDVDHGRSPDGSVSKPARFADGTHFEPAISKTEEFKEILELLRSLL